MFMVNWMFDILNFLGLVNKTGKMVFIGLDNAGKSTLLNVLKNNRMAAVNPTQFPTAQEIQIGGVTFTAWDLGGHKEARHLWVNYFPAISGIIFVVDVSDRDRLEECKKELNKVLADEDVADCPIAILGNKIDIPGCINEDELKQFFMLEGQTTGKNNPTKLHHGQRPLEIFMCSFLKKTGYGDAFRWMSNFF